MSQITYKKEHVEAFKTAGLAANKRNEVEESNEEEGYLEIQRCVPLNGLTIKQAEKALAKWARTMTTTTASASVSLSSMESQWPTLAGACISVMKFEITQSLISNHGQFTIASCLMKEKDSLRSQVKTQLMKPFKKPLI